MRKQNTKRAIAPSSAPAENPVPTPPDFAEYAASLLGELSKSAAGFGLTTLAHLMDLARQEARYHASNTSPPN